MKFDMIKRTVNYFVIGVVIVNVGYELFRLNNKTQNNSVIDNVQESSHIRKFINKLSKSRKLRTGLFSSILIFGLAVNSFQPEGTNVGHDPIHITLETKNFEDINLMEYMHFVSSPDFVQTNEDIKKIIINNDLDKQEKIILISYKLNSILNIFGRNKNPVFLVLIIRTLLTGAIPGYHGLSCVYSALLKLYTEGKISRKLYELLLEIFNEMIKPTQVKPARLDEILKKPSKIME